MPETTIPKMSWKGRLIFALVSGLFFTLLLCILDLFSPSSFYSWPALIFQGVTFALLMGLGMPYFFSRMGNRFLQVTPPELAADELLRYEGPANCFRGKEAVGGRLYLTSTRLVFISHKWNLQTGKTALLLKHITAVAPRKTMGLISNGLAVTTTEGTAFHFVVNEPTLWIQEIETAKAKAMT